MVMGECSAHSSLQAVSKVKFAAWLCVSSHLALTDLNSKDPCELSHMTLHSI